MKKLLLVGILAIFPKLAFAYSWGDLANEFKDNTKVTILQNAVPAYFYDVQHGRSAAGVLTDFTYYRFLSANAGWVSSYQDPDRGTIVLGGNLHVNMLLSTIFPNATAVVNGGSVLLPGGLKTAWDHLYIGVVTGYQTTEDDFTWGLCSGLEFKF